MRLPAGRQGLRIVYAGELGHRDWKISPCPSLLKRGNSSIRKREGRRDFTDRRLYYFENINKTKLG